MATNLENNGSSLPLDKETLLKLAIDETAPAAPGAGDDTRADPPVISDRGCVDPEN